jgi:hypothetical protein
MALYEVSQRFNNGSAKIFGKVDTDSVTLQGIVDMMPAGVSIYAPTVTGAVGVARAVPTNYIQALVSCFDKTDRKYNANYLSLTYGKTTLSDDDIVNACIGKVEVPNGTTCDQVNVSKYKIV